MTLKTIMVAIAFCMLAAGSFATSVGIAGELHSLAREGKVAALSIALSKDGVDKEERNARGDTPLLIAARNGNLRAIKLLVKSGANINAMDYKRRDILNIAITTKNPSLSQLALQLGADATLVTSVYDGGAIIYGSAKGEVEIVKMLIQAAAPVNRVNNIGWTALLEVAILGDGSDAYVKIARMLLDAGADKTIADKEGMTPLNHARKNGHHALADILS